MEFHGLINGKLSILFSLRQLRELPSLVLNRPFNPLFIEAKTEKAFEREAVETFNPLFIEACEVSYHQDLARNLSILFSLRRYQLEPKPPIGQGINFQSSFH